MCRIEKRMASFRMVSIDVFYHHAKFGEYRTTRAGCRCEYNDICTFLFLSVTERVARRSFEGDIFEHVLCQGLQAAFHAVIVVFSDRSALSKGPENAHLLCQVAP